jgi:hypothetical protein
MADGKPLDVFNSKEQLKYEVRWYRYQIGVGASDAYSGVYWERINEATENSFIFNPDVSRSMEKIKAIIVYDENIPYYSNELVFNNEEELPPSQ